MTNTYRMYANLMLVGIVLLLGVSSAHATFPGKMAGLRFKLRPTLVYKSSRCVPTARVYSRSLISLEMQSPRTGRRTGARSFLSTTRPVLAPMSR
jgi:hypothetical protein